MKKIKQMIQKWMEKKVELAIALGGTQDRTAIKSPYILGVWFYEPKMPEQSKGTE